MSTRWMLSEETVNQLLAQPETGMGFQFVEGIVNGASARLLVFNAEVAYDVSDVLLTDSDDPASILLNGTLVVKAIASAQAKPGSLAVSSLSVAPPRVTGGGSWGGGASAGVPPAKLTPPSSLVKSYSLGAKRLFHRFSAFKPDKRVNPATGDFVAGTYATTNSDFPLAPSGLAAVGRFALPNIQPASHHYRIDAPAGTQVTSGTVAPANGQAGGGVEVLFVNAVKNAQSPAFSSQLPDD